MLKQQYDDLKSDLTVHILFAEGSVLQWVRQDLREQAQPLAAQEGNARQEGGPFLSRVREDVCPQEGPHQAPEVSLQEARLDEGPTKEGQFQKQ